MSSDLGSLAYAVVFMAAVHQKQMLNLVMTNRRVAIRLKIKSWASNRGGAVGFAARGLRFGYVALEMKTASIAGSRLNSGGGTRNRTHDRFQGQIVTPRPRERGFDDLAVSSRRVAISSRQIRGRTDSGIPGAGQGAWSTTGYTASPHMAFGLSIITAMITGTSLPSRRVQSRNWSRLTLPFHVAPPWIS